MSLRTRGDGRGAADPRPVVFEVGVQRHPEGSVLVRFGRTAVLVAASVSEGVPRFLEGSGQGWVTAEYAMHPRCGESRQHRDGRRGRVDGRATEIQRLVGRSLRSAVALERLGERTITVDCDVLDADGGTRTAAITGGFVAVALALEKLRRSGLAGGGGLRAPVAAVSAGLVGGFAMVDLCAEEDQRAEMDLNLVATEAGEVVEVQGTAEGPPVPRERFDAVLQRAMEAIPALCVAQRRVLEEAGVSLARLFSEG